MRHRSVQPVFEITPRLVLGGLLAAGVEEDRAQLCARLREADVTLDEIAQELDFDDIYAAAYAEDNIDDAEAAAAAEIGRQIRDWLCDRLGARLERETVRPH